MSLAVAIQMDPVDAIDIKADSTRKKGDKRTTALGAISDKRGKGRGKGGKKGDGKGKAQGGSGSRAEWYRSVVFRGQTRSD